MSSELIGIKHREATLLGYVEEEIKSWSRK